LVYKNQNTKQMEPANYRDSGRVFTGLFLLAAGFLLLAYKMGAPIPFWLMTWPVALIALGLLIMIRRRFRSFPGLILILIGAFNLIDQFIPTLNFHDYILPLIIISVGLIFIFRPKNRWRHRHDWYEMKQQQMSREPEGEAMPTRFESSDYIDSTSILGGVKKIIVSKNFKGGDITCFMGGAEIDLSQADIQTSAVIDVTAVFGGCKLIVPANWEVKPEATAVFGGIDDKRSVNPANISSDKILIIQGTVVFGGIEIKSF
jgi:predicted membrane protein